MTNNKQQTAVEIFWNQLPEILPFTVGTETAVKLQEAYKQAKEMEKKQHKKTWLDSTSQFDNAAEMTFKKDFDEHYNETYGGGEP